MTQKSAVEQLAQQQLDAQQQREEFARTYPARLRRAGFFEGLRLIQQHQQLGFNSVDFGRGIPGADVAWMVWAAKCLFKVAIIPIGVLIVLAIFLALLPGPLI